MVPHLVSLFIFLITWRTVLAQNVVTLYGNESTTLPGQPVLNLWPVSAMWTTQDGYMSFTPFGGDDVPETCPAIRVIFNGTGVAVYGGPRNTLNLSSIVVKLDGEDQDSSSSSSNITSTITPLFVADVPESPFQHVLVIYTTDCAADSSLNSILSLAFVNITTSEPVTPTASDSIGDYSINATHRPEIGEYDFFFRGTPVLDGARLPPDLTTLAGEMLTSVDSNSAVGATFSVIFRGTGIQAFTYYLTGGGPPLNFANIEVDGLSYGLFSGQAGLPEGTLVMLANVFGLYPGWHTLDLRTVGVTGSFTPETGDVGLTFAFANVTGFVSNSSASSTSTSSFPTASATGKTAVTKASIHLVGPIVGSILGALVIALIVGFLWWWRVRRARRRPEDIMMIKNAETKSDEMSDSEGTAIGTSSAASRRKGKGKGKGSTSVEMEAVAMLTMRATGALPEQPHPQLRAQRTGLGSALEEKIRERDALEAAIGPHGNFYSPDVRDAEIDRLRSELAQLHTALQSHALDQGDGQMESDALPGYQREGASHIPLLDEKVRERDALEGGIGDGERLAAGTDAPGSSTGDEASDWRDDMIRRLESEVGQLHIALGMDPSPGTQTH